MDRLKISLEIIQVFTASIMKLIEANTDEIFMAKNTFLSFLRIAAITSIYLSTLDIDISHLAY